MGSWVVYLIERAVATNKLNQNRRIRPRANSIDAQGANINWHAKLASTLKLEEWLQQRDLLTSVSVIEVLKVLRIGIERDEDNN